MIGSVEWQMVSFGVQQSHIGMHDLDEESNMLVRILQLFYQLKRRIVAEDLNVR